MFRWDHDWFSKNIGNLEYIFNSRVNEAPISILEIGAFEGASTSWFLQCVNNSTVTTIDTWLGGADHDPNNPEIDFKKVKQNFDYNMSFFKNRVTVMQSDSYTALTKLIQENKQYDFVFVDGSHTAIDVNLDLILAFKLIKIGGLIYADDYYWGFNDKTIYESPKLGIDSFVSVYRDKLHVVNNLTNNHALCVMKVKQ